MKKKTKNKAKKKISNEALFEKLVKTAAYCIVATVGAEVAVLLFMPIGIWKVAAMIALAVVLIAIPIVCMTIMGNADKKVIHLGADPTRFDNELDAARYAVYRR